MNIISLCSRTFRDALGLTQPFRGYDTHIAEAVRWLSGAQDSQPDGGVSLRYSLIHGWDQSYPETTGYIIPTFLEYAARTGDQTKYDRAIRMADWELSIQNPDGGFKGGSVGSSYESFVFDTGQILFGLIAAYNASSNTKYLDSAIRAGDWLVEVQDPDGSWSRHAFNSIPHTYYSRVAWALAELGKLTSRDSYIFAARRNIDWAISKQRPNGWFDSAGFTIEGNLNPYTHTISYTMEGILGTGACLDEDSYIDATARSADSLIEAITRDDYCFGTYDSDWRGLDRFSCLTGTAQIAWVMLRLYQMRGEERYLKTAGKLNRFCCQRQILTGPKELMGAIGGSSPTWGKYQRLAFPNWAAKFFIDAISLEKDIHEKENLS